MKFRSPTETVQEFIEAFISAWPEGDAAKLASFFGEDAVYHNMPMEPIKGREAIQATLAAFMGMGGRVGVAIAHIVADGAIVMTERVDHFIGAEKTISLPVMGIFEVHDGVIVSWRDYFDLDQFTSQMPDGA
ncbi:MAG: limonene-1,2-epoxide hydrolase family protein [Acidimicrobiales bacterium]